VLGLIEKEHLPDHHGSDRRQLAHPEVGQPVRRRSAGGPKAVKDVHHVGVAGHHPGVQIGIPVHRVLVAQASVQRVGIGQDVGIEEVIEAEWR
jgi:hypothetical protein